jgi:uncharacterized membrane protein
MTTEMERRSARFVVRFVLISMVPAFVGFVIGFSAESPIVVISVWAAVVAADVAMMWVVRKRRRTRDRSVVDPDGPSVTPVHVIALAVIGIVVSAVTAALQLDEAGDEWVRLVLGVLGGACLLVAGLLAIRHQNLV